MRLDEVVVGPGLRVGGEIGEVADRAAGDAGCPELLAPRCCVLCGKHGIERRDQCRRVGATAVGIGEAVAGRERCCAERLRHLRPTGVRVVGAQEQPLVARLVHVPQRVHRIGARALRAAPRVAREIRLQALPRQVELGAVQRRVDPLAAAGAAAVVQGHHDGERRHQAAVRVARAHAEIDRRLTGLAEAGHQTGQRLHRHVERRLGDGAEAAVAGVGRVDEPRVDGAQLVIAEVPTLQQLDAHVGEEDVRFLGEAVQHLAAFLLLQIDGDALLVAVDDQEILVPVRHRQRLDAAHAAALIAAVRPLDLDHLGAEIGEVLRRHRSLEPDGQIDDANPFQRLHKRLFSPQRHREHRDLGA